MTRRYGVIFDNDGVLVDSEAFSIEAYRRSIEEQGVALRDEDDERYCGLTDADIILDMQGRYGAEVNLERFSERKRELYLQLAGGGELRPFAGVTTLLDALRIEGIPYILASSGSREKIAFNLEHAGLASYFPHVISGEDFSRGKPDPEIFMRAGEKLEMPPEDCVVFEDSINGLKAARAAGMVAVAVANTFATERLAPHADHVVTTMENVTPSVIEQWLKRSTTA